MLCLTALSYMGCGDAEWGSATIGKMSCSFGSFNDFAPNAGRVVKMSAGNNGDNLYILDNSYYVHAYKRDNIYECGFNLENSYGFNGFPSDVLFANNSFYVQDGAALKSKDGKEECYAKTGVFALSGNELAVGSNAGLEVWSINNCLKKGSIISQNVLALVATSSEYYIAEAGGYANEPQNFAMYSKNGDLINREPMSSTPGNEKNFCSADRIAANNSGVYLLDKKCRKIGVFDAYAVWRKTISLDSIGIRTPLDIAADKYPYILILHANGVERIRLNF